MVHLILSSTKGNQGLRYFPYTGYLGLTPVTVEGLVRTRVDADNKALLASSITISVRCYELRIGRVNVSNSNCLVDYTQTLWRAQPSSSSITTATGEVYEPIEALEFPFRLTLPTHAKGFSTAVFVDYRCSWRIEAVLNHAPISGIGTRQLRHFELPLVRYDIPPSPIPPSPSTSSLGHSHKPSRIQPHHLTHQTTSRKVPRIRYTFSPPATPIGPSDIVSIPIWLLPVEGREELTVKGVTVIIERRIQINDHAGAITPPHTPKSPAKMIPPSPKGKQRASPRASPLPSPSPSPSSSFQEKVEIGTTTVSSDLSSNPTITPYSIFPSTASLSSSTRPLLSSSGSDSSLSGPSSNPPQPHPHNYPDPSTYPIPPSPGLQSAGTARTFIATKTITNAIIGAESSGAFNRDEETGIWSKTVTMQWPAARSHSRWAIGETIVGSGTGAAAKEMGEAEEGGGVSELVNVRFYVRVKVTISSPNGTDTLELAEKEVLVVLTNDAERKLAMAKWAELTNSDAYHHSTRSKSKSPRRSKRDRDLTGDALTGDEDLIPPPPLLKSKAGKGSSSAGSVTGAANGEGNVEKAHRSSKTTRSGQPRRPHTSAGPRDRPVGLAGSSAMKSRTGVWEMSAPLADSQREKKRERESVSRPGTSQGDPAAGAVLPSQPVGGQGEQREKKRRSGMVGSFWSSASSALKDKEREHVAPRMSSTLSGSSAGTSGNGTDRSGTTTTRSTSSNTSVSSSLSSSSRSRPDKEVQREVREREMRERATENARVREWEQELAKIEQVSQKKSSDLFSGFGFGKWGRKKEKS